MMLPRPAVPDGDFLRLHAQVMGLLVLEVSLLLAPGSRTVPRVIGRLGSRVKQATDRALGNRAGDCPLSWDDERYILAGALRALLAELEGGAS